MKSSVSLAKYESQINASIKRTSKFQVLSFIVIPSKLKTTFLKVHVNSDDRDHTLLTLYRCSWHIKKNKGKLNPLNAKTINACIKLEFKKEVTESAAEKTSEKANQAPGGHTSLP